MTTQNHTALAGVAAIISNNASTEIKAGVIAGLILSHLIADAIPHLHFYSFKSLPKGWFGAIIELGGGLIILPIIIWRLTGINPFYLAACVIASNLFDFLVAAKISIIDKLNNMAHWWSRYTGHYLNPVNLFFETTQTLILFGILFRLISTP